MHPQETKAKANEYLPDSRQGGLTGCRWGGVAMLTWSCSDDCWPLTPAPTPLADVTKSDVQMLTRKCDTTRKHWLPDSQTTPDQCQYGEEKLYRRIILPAVKEGQYLPVRLDLYPGVLGLEQVWVELTAAPHTLMPSLWRWLEAQRQSTLNQ